MLQGFISIDQSVQHIPVSGSTAEPEQNFLRVVFSFTSHGSERNYAGSKFSVVPTEVSWFQNYILEISLNISI